MKTKQIAVALLALIMLAWAPAAYAVDNLTEFGIEDDLTVLGNQGTALDPDAEIKGFTVFGSTQSAYTGAVIGAGNVVVNGFLSVSSGAYFVGGSTFASGGAYFTGVSSFSTPGNIHVGGGLPNQVLKKIAGGGMTWADDSVGAGEIAGIAGRLVMYQADGTGGIESMFHQSGNFLTLLSGSSMTILGDGTDGLGVTGAVRLNGATSILGSNNFTVGTGISSLGGILNVAGDVDLNARLNVDGTSTFVSSMTAKGDTQFGDATSDLHSINRVTEAGVALSVDSPGTSGNFAAKFYSGGSLAAWIKKK
jgi:hypothetical protein